MKEIKSYSEWLGYLKSNDLAYLLLYKKTGTAVNRCAYDNLENALKVASDVKVFVANL